MAGYFGGLCINTKSFDQVSRAITNGVSSQLHHNLAKWPAIQVIKRIWKRVEVVDRIDHRFNMMLAEERQQILVSLREPTEKPRMLTVFPMTGGNEMVDSLPSRKPMIAM